MMVLKHGWLVGLNAFFALGCASAAIPDPPARTPANAAAASTLAALDHARCSAERRIGDGRLAVGAVRITVDRGAEPLVSVSFESDPTQDFTLGRRHASGRDFTGAREFRCEYVVNQQPEVDFHAKYVCADQDEATPDESDALSSVSYRHAKRTGVICRARSACWTISDCRTEPTFAR